MSSPSRGSRYGRIGIGLVLGLLVTTGCAAPDAPTPEGPSAFYATFSLASLLDDERFDIDRGARMVFTEEAGRTEVAGLAFHHAHQTAELTLSLGGEQALFATLRTGLRERITAQDLAVERILETPGHLAIAYADRRTQGWADVTGVRREGESYRLVVVLGEHELPAGASREAG